MDNHPPSPINELEKEVSKSPVIDSFYLVECKWPKPLHIESLQDSAWQVQEIMTNYKDCYVRHNGLVRVLKDGN